MLHVGWYAVTAVVKNCILIDPSVQLGVVQSGVVQLGSVQMGADRHVDMVLNAQNCP